MVGDASANNIVVSADASGNLQVTNNGSAVAINTTLGTPTNANLKTLSVDARNGNDSILIDKSLNVLDANGKPAAGANGTLRGGGGNDTITVQSGGFVGGVVGNAIVATSPCTAMPVMISSFEEFVVDFNADEGNVVQKMFL